MRCRRIRLLTGSGCAGDPIGISNFHIACSNVGDQAIDEVVISFDDFEAGPMYVDPGAMKVNLLVGDNHAVPVNVSIRWKTIGGKSRDERVDVGGILAGKKGVVRIVFSIDSQDRVTVSVTSEPDTELDF